MAEQKYKIHEKVLLEAEVLGVYGHRYGTDNIFYNLYLEGDGRVIEEVADDYIQTSNENLTEWAYHDNIPWCSYCGEEIPTSKAQTYKFCPYCGRTVKHFTKEEESDV